MSHSAELSSSPPQTPRRAYKWGRTHAPSDQWRQRLLASCMKRMKDTRHSGADERRRQRLRIVSEANAAADEQAALLALLEEFDELEQLQQQQQQQQQQQPEEEEVDDDVFIEQLELYQQQISNDSVLCPVCCNASLNLMGNRHGITCSCGVNVVFKNEIQGTVGLNDVRERLDFVFSSHQNVCQGHLEFHVRNGYQERESSLWASCRQCRQECLVL